MSFQSGVGRRPSDGDQRARRLVSAVVFVAFASGFLNLVPTPISLATIILDSCAIAMLVYFVTNANAIRTSETWVIFLFLTVLSYIVLLWNGPEPLSERLMAMRSGILYSSGGLFASFALRTKASSKRLIRTIMVLGLASAIFGCIQFILRSKLPEWLLYSRDEKLFGYWGTDITRSTGLLGNTIVYGTVLTLVFSLWASSIFQRGRISTTKRLLCATGAAVVFLGVLSTLSRVAIASSLAILSIVAGIATIRALQERRISASVLTLPSVIILVVWIGWSTQIADAIENSFLYRGVFLAENESVAGSTAGHEAFSDLAIRSFETNPVWGVGLGTQQQDSRTASSVLVIADGFHLSNLVEGGLVLIIPTILLLVSLSIRLVSASRSVAITDQWIPIGVLLFLQTQLLFAGFYNTGFYGKVPNVIFWISFGTCVALSRATQIDLHQFESAEGSNVA